MGKSLIIKGADFSANGINKTVDITTLLSGYFHAQSSIGRFDMTMYYPNEKRCCVRAFLFSEIGIDISGFSQIVVNIKPGYDYVFGTGPTPDNPNSWHGWNGNIGVQDFVWITENQQGVATIDSTTLGMSLNLRHDDDTTTFDPAIELTDIVDSVSLIP